MTGRDGTGLEGLGRVSRALTQPTGTRALTWATVVLVLTSLMALGLRAPHGATLAIAGDVPDTSTAAPSLPPNRVPAPRVTPAPSEQLGPVRAPATVAPSEDRGPAAPVAQAALVVPDPDSQAPAREVAAPAQPAPPVAPPTTPVGPATGDTARARFASQFPAHAAATQDPADPATRRWALLVGVNEHSGATHDNLGSRPDAEALYAHLIDLGWRADHVLLLVDHLATRENMTEGVRWLARKTTAASVAVFSYSGHAKQFWGYNVDGDDEVPDEALWPSDNDHIPDGEFAALMATVPAGRMWLNFMACEAAGFLDGGLVRDGRVVTFSSAEDEKSYEDPSVGYSVWGWNLVVQGMRNGMADANENGDVTVQEAATFAIPRAATRTANQTPHGPQHGGMVDRSGGPLSLRIPAPPPEPAPADTESAPVEEPTTAPSSSPPPSREPCLLGILCS